MKRFCRGFQIYCDKMDGNSDDELHKLLLEKAFMSMYAHADRDRVIICAKNSKEVVFNRDILILFSSFIRSILTNLPNTSR